MVKSPGLPNDMTLFRGIYGDISSLEKLIGTTIEDKGFVSTSVDAAAAEFKGNYIMEIHCSAGTKGIWLNSLYETSGKKSEMEFLLNRGASLVVKDVISSGPMVKMPIVIGELIL